HPQLGFHGRGPATRPRRRRQRLPREGRIRRSEPACRGGPVARVEPMSDDTSGPAMIASAAVLIADDSLVIRAVVRAGLEDEGYRVTEAIDGLAALEQSRHHPPDVILLHVEIPAL